MLRRPRRSTANPSTRSLCSIPTATAPDRNSRRESGIIGSLLIALLFLANSAAGQVVPPVVPGFPNVEQVPGTALSGLNAPEQGRTAVIAYHNGILFTVPEIPSSQPGADFQVRSWDISDPTAPVELARWGTTPMPLSAHGYIQSGDSLVLGPNTGMSSPWTFRATAPFTLQRTTFPGLVCIGLRGCAYQPWYLGPVYTLYNTTSGNAVLQRNGATLSSWDHLGLTGVIGHPFILGNLAIFASDQSRTGVATYDISDPAQPLLLDVLTTGGPGGYHPEVWGGDGKLYVVMEYRDHGNGFEIVDVTDPSDMRFVVDRPLPGSEAMYAQFQDEYAFIGDHKIDMRSFESVLFLNGNQVERPNQPGVIGIDTSQFALPLGNLLVTGGIGQNEGMAIWAHQAAPDLRGPSVGYHIPRAGQAHYPVGSPISLLIHETLESTTIINGVTFIVRPLGGAAISGRLIFAYDDILTFTPDQPLATDTTYEVVIPEGGIKDAAGNGISGYSFNFSTGASVIGNTPPVITSFEASVYPAQPGAAITLSASASDADDDPLEYRFDFGDGSPKSEWSTAPSVTISYDTPGHYRALAQVRDPSGAFGTQPLSVSVLAPPAGTRPSNSSQLVCNASSRRIWTVEPDNDVIVAVHADSLEKEMEIAVCADPRSVAQVGSGNLWVTCYDDDRVRVLDASGSMIADLPLRYGSAPVSVAISPDGGTAYVALEGTGELARFNTSTLQQTGSLALGPKPRAIAVSANGARVLVTRFISPRDHAEVWDVNAATFSLARTLRIGKFGGDLNADTTASGRGVANYLAGIVISPDGQSAWIAANKPNTERGRVFSTIVPIPTPPPAVVDLDEDNTVRNIIVEIDIASGNVVRSIDIDNSDSATALTFSPLADYLFVTLQGNNALIVLDALAIDSTAGLAGFVGRLATGLAPQAVCVDSGSNRTFVKNLMSRDLTVLDTDALFRRGDISLSSSDVPLLTSEKLAPDVLLGKEIFYNAEDRRMSAEGYLSCATCHVDGGHDGRVWDFSGRGEGFRNTISLHGRAGVAHGNVHWSANFDEIQDFEHDIRAAFGGSGFLSNADFAATNAPLGAPKAGLSVELDSLAAYLASLDAQSVPRSPWRNSNGSLTAAALRGRAVFSGLACESCHSGEGLTDSSLGAETLHDLGTLRTTSGHRLGGALSGIDTPTLLGLWESAPYFHDGSARTLGEVFQVAGGEVLQAESGTATNALIVRQFTDINNDDTVHQRAYVALGRSGARLTLSNVAGGSGGNGALEIRYSVGYTAQTLQVSVNGTPQTISLPLVGNDPPWRLTNWGRARVESIVLNPGATNTIELSAPAAFPNIGIDDVVVTTAEQLALAQPHRQVLALASGDRADLDAYLLQLDGRPDDGPLPTVTATATATTIPTATRTPTLAATATETATPTTTATSTSTETTTRTPTQTATETSSDTATHTPTSTATHTGTETATPTESATETATQTPGATDADEPTATTTHTPAVAATATATPLCAIAQRTRLRLLASPLSLRFSGEATLPQPWGIDPLARGIRLVVEGVLDASVPGGAFLEGIGWRTNKAATKWLYSDRSGRHGGVVRVTIKDRSSQSPGLIRWQIKVQGGVTTALPPQLVATMVLGAPGECATAQWPGTSARQGRCDGSARRLACH